MRKSKKMMAFAVATVLTATAMPPHVSGAWQTVVQAAETTQVAETTQTEAVADDSVTVTGNQLAMTCSENGGFRWDVQFEDEEDVTSLTDLTEVVSYISTKEQAGYPDNMATRTLDIYGRKKGKTEFYCFLNNGAQVKAVYHATITVDENKNVTIETPTRIEGVFVMNTFLKDEDEKDYKFADSSVADLEVCGYINQFFDENGQVYASRRESQYSVIFKVIGKKAGATSLTINSRNMLDFDAAAQKIVHNIVVDDQLVPSTELITAPSRYRFEKGAFDGMQGKAEGDTYTLTSETKKNNEVNLTIKTYTNQTYYISGEAKKISVTALENGFEIDPVDAKSLSYQIVSSYDVGGDLPVNKGKLRVYLDKDNYVKAKTEDNMVVSLEKLEYRLEVGYTYYVTADYIVVNGGGTSTGITKGEKLLKEDVVLHLEEGCKLLGCYKDKNFLHEWNFEKDQVVANTIIYLKYKKLPLKAKVSKLKVVSKKKGQAKLTWKCKDDILETNGYEIKYSTNKKLSKAKVYYSESYMNTEENLKGLKKGKVYYFSVRPYAYNEKGKKIYGKATQTVKVKIKK